MPTTLELAARLLDARKNRTPLNASDANGPINIEQAYAVQRAVWHEITQGARPAAWKVGAPNRHSEPTSAAIFPHHVRNSPARFSANDFHTLGIEAEIAVRFGRALPAQAEPYRRDEIVTAIASVHIAMELVDTRLADPEAAGPLWRLADNLVNGALVIGAEILNWRALDFSGLTVRVHANTRLLAETIGRQPLDDLFYCLPWWLAHNGGAQAGDIITTGAWNGMHPVDLPTEVGVAFVGVGDISARIF
jgi:2-keto-4-pentenoate hydratase